MLCQDFLLVVIELLGGALSSKIPLSGIDVVLSLVARYPFRDIDIMFGIQGFFLFFISVALNRRF